MKYVNDLRDIGLQVNWGTLLIGLEGPGKYAPLLTLDDVCAFACEQLSSTTCSEGAAAIVVASSEGSAETRAILRKLADEEGSKPDREGRKWRLLLLKRVIAKLPDDPLYGLLTLTEFWERFDFPPDSPHVVQGRGNNIAPGDYFTEDNYRYLVQRHRDWISTESSALRGSADPEPHNS